MEINGLEVQASRKEISTLAEILGEPITIIVRRTGDRFVIKPLSEEDRPSPVQTKLIISLKPEDMSPESKKRLFKLLETDKLTETIKSFLTADHTEPGIS